MVSPDGFYYPGDALDFVLQGKKVLVTCGTMREAEERLRELDALLRRMPEKDMYRVIIITRGLQMSIGAGSGEVEFVTSHSQPNLRQGKQHDVTYITEYALDMIWRDLFDRIGPAAIAMKDGPPMQTDEVLLIGGPKDGWVYDINSFKRPVVKPQKTPEEVSYIKLWDNLYIWDDPRHLLVGTQSYTAGYLRARMRVGEQGIQSERDRMRREILREAPDLDIRTLSWDSWEDENFDIEVLRLRAVVVYDWNNDFKKEIR